MKSTEIKKQLHQHIDLIDDTTFLNELEFLVQSRLGNNSSFEYSLEQLKAIKNGRSQIKEGLGIKNEDLVKDIQKWLDKK